MPAEKNHDEIDLMELFLKAINTFRVNFWLIVAFFILGSILGLGYFYSSKKVYENKMIVSSDILTESNGKILVDVINRHRNEGNLNAVAETLHIPESMADQVGQLTMEKITETTERKEDEGERFLITVVVYDQTILPALQAGIVNYLENNDFVKVRVDQEKRYFNETITKIEEEIRDLEEFKQRIFKGDFFEHARGNVMFDPTEVNTKILELNEKKIKMQNDLQLVNSVQVVVGFTRFEKPTGPRLSVALAAGSTVGLFFVAMLIAFKSIRKLVSMADAQK